MTKRDNRRVDQEFLDSAQYETGAILQYERIYGADFVSPGGAAIAAELIQRLQLEPGARVLDVGCGLGGSAFLMARDFGLCVDGIDLSRNMLTLAGQRLVAQDLAAQVSLSWGDCLDLDCGAIYDGIYSRDVFLHIHDKPRLFALLAAALRAGGKLLFTDYCCGPKPWAREFAAYVEDRGYALQTVDDYAERLCAAGFERIEACDETPRFIESLEAELARIEALDLPASERAELARSWRQKLSRARQGDHRWGLFCARKPLTANLQSKSTQEQ